MIVDFTYSVKWKETTIPFERRMEKYSRYSFLPQHLEVGQLYVLAAQAQLPKNCWLVANSTVSFLLDNGFIYLHPSESSGYPRSN